MLQRGTRSTGHHQVVYVSLCLALLAAAIHSPTAIAQVGRDSIPNANLEVAVRQNVDGKLSPSFHIFELTCWSQQCSLSSITLNVCIAFGSNKPTSVVKLERWSTTEGNLTVIPTHGTLEARINHFGIDGEGSITLRFGYSTASSSIKAKDLTSFSGGYVKNSTNLQRVITAEYVPFQGTYSQVEVDCPLQVPGVKENK